MKQKKPVSPTQKKGQHFESLALNYLQKRGLELIAKNYYCVCGEIDLILKDHETLVFIEVRYRKNSRHGSPLESIHWAKQKKIIKSAKLFLLNHGLYEQLPCRFDVIGLTQDNALVEYHWIKNAFQ